MLLLDLAGFENMAWILDSHLNLSQILMSSDQEREEMNMTAFNLSQMAGLPIYVNRDTSLSQNMCSISLMGAQHGWM